MEITTTMTIIMIMPLPTMGMMAMALQKKPTIATMTKTTMAPVVWIITLATIRKVVVNVVAIMIIRKNVDAGCGGCEVDIVTDDDAEDKRWQ